MSPTEIQRKAALEIANSRRFAFATTRAHLSSLPIAESRAEAASIFRDPNELHSHMKGRYLLSSITRFGPAKIGMLIRKTGLAAGRLERKIGELSERERHLIADHIEDPTRGGPVPHFTTDELALVRDVFDDLASRVPPSKGRKLRAIADKCEAAA